MTNYIPVAIGGACLLFFSLPPVTALARGYLSAITPSHLQGRVFACDGSWSSTPADCACRLRDSFRFRGQILDVPGNGDRGNDHRDHIFDQADQERR